MRAAAFFLAQHATQSDGLLNALGAGATVISPPVYPVTLNLFAVAILEFDENELDLDHAVRVEVKGPDDADRVSGYAEGSIRTVHKPGTAWLPSRLSLSAFALDLRLLAVPAAGGYHVVLSVAGNELGRAEFLATPAALDVVIEPQPAP